MKKTIFLLLLVMITPVAMAQSDSTAVKIVPAPTVVRKAFGFLSYDSVFHSMKEYAQAVKNLKQLRTKYDAEMKRSEDDFNKKYEDFLDGQKDFPQTILLKRQNELQEMMDKNIAFKNEARKLLRDAENDAFTPLQERLSQILITIGREKGFAFILNTDENACPYINPAQGEDITALAISRVK
jgi:outer membrane protein